MEFRELSKVELMIIIEALLKAKRQSETDGFETEKRILDSLSIATNESCSTNIQLLYDRLHQKMEEAIKEMKDV
ncbi:MAG: hypothetical protein FWC06_04880 [Treponema sp.]|nr:hypothetical protein [Treponema sp.]